MSSEADSQQQELNGAMNFEFGGGWSFSADVDAAAFWRYVKSVEPVLGVALMEFAGGEIRTTGTDPAKTMIVEDAAVASEDADGTLRLGVNFHELRENIPPYHEGGSFRLTVNARDGETTLSVDGTEGGCTVEASDPDMLRSTPSTKEFPASETTVSLPGYVFQGAVGSISDASDTAVRLREVDGQLVVEGSDTTEFDTAREWRLDVATTSFEPVKIGASLMHDIARAVPVGGDVDVEISDGPLCIKADHATYWVAPRIEGGDVE